MLLECAVWCRCDLIEVESEQLLDLRGRLRRAEQIALHFRTAERAQQPPLRLGFDAFRRGRHVAGGSDVHDRLDDAG